MRRQHPNHQVSIPVSLAVWHQLLGGSSNTGFEKEDWEIAAEAIDEWTRRHNPDALPMPATKGYQWKRLFLPEGTLLRTVFAGKNHHCMVEGDQILHDKQAVSPSGFVNAVGGIRRNAWLCTWILFPDSKDWKLADTLRTHERARRASKLARDAHREPATLPAAARAPATGAPLAAPNACDAPDAIHTQHGPAQQANAHAERQHLQQHPGITLSPPGFMCGTEQRINDDDRMTTLLRQELLPLLYRLCAVNNTRRQAHPSPGA